VLRTEWKGWEAWRLGGWDARAKGSKRKAQGKRLGSKKQESEARSQKLYKGRLVQKVRRILYTHVSFFVPFFMI